MTPTTVTPKRGNPYSPQRGERAHAHTHTYTHTQTHTHTHPYMPREMHELRKSRVQPPGDSRWKGARFRPPTRSPPPSLAESIAAQASYIAAQAAYAEAL